MAHRTGNPSQQSTLLSSAPYSSWLLLNLIGGMIAGLAESRFEFLGTLLLAGTPLAVAQGIYLRHFLLQPLRRSFGWAIGLAAGWPLAHFLYASNLQWFTVPDFAWQVPAINAIRLGFVLFLIGLAQMLLFLPPQKTWPGFWRWPLISLVAGASIGLISSLVCRYGCDLVGATAGRFAVGALLGAVGWFSYALLTLPFLPPRLHLS